MRLYSPFIPKFLSDGQNVLDDSLDEALGHLRPHFEKNEKWAIINATVLKAYGYAFRNDFIYDDRKCRAVIEKMTPQEQEMFNLDMKKVDWNITLRDMYKNIFNEFIH
ncbi:MAG TPA: hypothetical protein DEF42_17010 [Desulfosporosinus sp.]|nr:hypothetical protein [Desulfosporosinus sp.]